jgi:hypothetical protein
MRYNMKAGMTEKNKVVLICPNLDCGHRWMYRGKSNFYASCPFCRTNVHVFKNKLENLCRDKSSKSKSNQDTNNCDSTIRDSPRGAHTN